MTARICHIARICHARICHITLRIYMNFTGTRKSQIPLRIRALEAKKGRKS